MASFNNKVFRQSYFYTLAKPPRHFVPPLHRRGTFALCALLFAFSIGTANADITSDNYLERKTGITAATAGQIATYIADDNGGAKLGGATLSAVATSGSYNDLSDKPTISTIPTALSVADALAGTATDTKLVSAKNMNIARGALATLSGTSPTYTASLDGFVLDEGARLMLYVPAGSTLFNMQETATLNVNSTGAKELNGNHNNGVFLRWDNTYARVVQVIYTNGEYYIEGAMEAFYEAGASIRGTNYNGSAQQTQSPNYVLTSLMTFIGKPITLGGTASAYTLTDTDNYAASTAYTNQKVSVKMNITNAANATLAVNSQGAKPIFYKGAAIRAGMLQSGASYEMAYDGTNYNVITGANNGGIPLPTADCESGDKCILTYDNATFTWERITD
jgi:hypothetical protein